MVRERGNSVGRETWGRNEMSSSNPHGILVFRYFTHIHTLTLTHT